MFDPQNDGIDHVNIYSKGKKELGRLLSNFAYAPFNYPPYGYFHSVEGFWYWYFSGMVHDDLKLLSGFEAKKVGKKYIVDDDRYPITDEDKSIILEAIRCKLRQNKHILDMLVDNDLPLSHYYCYNDDVVVDKPEYNWIIDELYRIKELMVQTKLKNHINMLRTAR